MARPVSDEGSSGPISSTPPEVMRARVVAPRVSA